MFVASVAKSLSVERDVSVVFVVSNATDDVDTALNALRAAYVATDRQLAAVRSQSAWPPRRPGDPAHLAGVDAFIAALSDVRNTTVTSSRSPEVDGTLSSMFTFYVNANEYLLLGVATMTSSMQVPDSFLAACQLINTSHTIRYDTTTIT